jgi:uncharacterized protein
MRALIVRVVDFCIKRPWRIILLALLLTGAAGAYSASHFAIHTDVDDLISPNLPWSQRAFQYMKEFPQRDILVVVDAPTPEIADQASNKLAHAIEARPDRFRSVSHLGTGRFFEQNGLLFLGTDQVRQITHNLSRANQLIGTLAADPSIRGTQDAISLVTIGVERGEVKLDDLARPLTLAADTVDDVLAGRPAHFSWRVLASGKPATPSDLRRFLQIEPVLDFTALQPGRAATDTINQIVSDLQLGNDGVRVRQTGRIPIDDAAFASIKQNAGLNAVLSLTAVLLILWFALRSGKIMLAVSICVFAGMAISTAVGLLLVGALNLISVAFFVLFVGLGIDFGIQFSVRYRAERHEYADLHVALRSAARKVGAPLLLAAVAIAVGFFSFLPTDYRGLAELGEVAGVGMLIAFFTSITLLPALLQVLKPKGEPDPVGLPVLAPVDRFLQRHRIPVVAGTIIAVVLASPLLLFLRFDFEPLHLSSTEVEPVATFLELRSDPQTGANAIDILAPNLQTGDTTAKRIAALPQVAQAKTLSNLIPTDQNEKLKLIGAAQKAIDADLNPTEVETPPTDQENIEALTDTASSLAKVAGTLQSPGAVAARRLSDLLSRIAKADPAARQKLEAAVVPPLRFSLDQLRAELKPQHVSIATIPSELSREWLTSDGQARIEVLPKGDPDDTQNIRNFVRAVTAAEPTATGPAVLLYQAANTVVHAFILSGIFSLSAIAILLWITLRRFVDVLLTLVPLLIAGAVTLELCAALDLPLNFANIIALPLLLGVGVAFKIYYIVAWRAGQTALLQSALTRAVIFSAMTTATAFGSLWFSSHPGMSSMGRLMALALVCTMLAAVFFQPALMGAPREKSQSLRWKKSRRLHFAESSRKR